MLAKIPKPARFRVDWERTDLDGASVAIICLEVLQDRLGDGLELHEVVVTPVQLLGSGVRCAAAIGVREIDQGHGSLEFVIGVGQTMSVWRQSQARIL